MKVRQPLYLNYLRKEVLPSFDLIFLDPPFNQELIASTLSLLSKASLIHLKSKIYIESEYELSLDFLMSNMSHKCKIDKQKKSLPLKLFVMKIFISL